MIPRLHALWGLGQIGEVGLRVLAESRAGLDDAPDEVRAQLARVAGDAGARDWLPLLRAMLADPSPRVRFFAAQSLGRLADRESIEPLVALLRENADRDVFLRHAAVLALHRIGDHDAVFAHRADASRSVRLAVLLVLRQARDPRIAGFLADADPLLVVEAARAIYDVPIDGAMSALAGMADRVAPAAAGDRQIGEALHRRVIGANVRLRTEAGAAALARYVADERQLERLRELALEALARYAEPPVRDLTMGFHRPLAKLDRAVVASVLYAQGRALVDSSLGARALEIAGEYGVSPLSAAELIARADSPTAEARERVAALAALRARATGLGAEEGAGRTAGADAESSRAAVRAAAERALADADFEVRIAGRELLSAVDPEAGLVGLLVAAERGADAAERRHAWRGLGASADPRARNAIAQGLVDWQSGALPDEVALEVLEAALASGEAALADRARAILDLGADRADRADRANGVDGAVVARRWALAGGDPRAGRAVFQTVGDCQRCHGDPEAPGAAAGHGGRIAPALAGVAGKGAEYALESVLVPDAQIAPGFESPSGMPPVGLVLEPRALRDLVAYLMTLD